MNHVAAQLRRRLICGKIDHSSDSLAIKQAQIASIERVAYE